MNTFPTLQGLGWDIKRETEWQTVTETSSSGAEYRTGRWVIPHYTFTMKFDYLSQADFTTLLTFFNGQKGSLTAFLLPISNDSQLTIGTLTPTPDGVNTIFQIPLPAQTNVVGAATILDNGAAAGSNSVSASGQVTFTTAPASGHTLTASCSYAYVVRFDSDKFELNQFANQMYEQQGLTFRTVR